MRTLRHFRVAHQRVVDFLRPSRLVRTLFLLGAMGLAIWLLVVVVSENAVTTAGQGNPVAGPPSSPPTKQPTSTPSTTSPGSGGATIPLGVYAGPGAPVAAAAFSADAGAPVPYAFDYLDGRSWQYLSNPLWFFQQWNGSGFRMIWGVPMLPDSGGSLTAGAAGLYDGYFSQLAYSLVAHGQAASIILLGWDAAAPGLPWSVSTGAQAAQYVAYWRQIVTTMRTVAGEQFQFVWDGSPGSNAVSPSSLYPGSAWVDIVATDAFDQGATTVSLGWNGFAASPFGPDWFGRFAQREHKPFLIAKWGVVPSDEAGGGDNAQFVRQFLSWADREHLFAAVTWDYGAWALTGGAFPRAARELRTVAAAGAINPIARALDTGASGQTP